jgi:hypothetical protein
METKTLNELWNEVFKFGYNVRRTNKNGFQMWQPVKEKYSRDNKKYTVTNGNIKKFATAFLKVDNSDEDNIKYSFEHCEFTLIDETECGHFFIQHFRIPLAEKYELTLVKILQIAYNAGQFKAEREKGIYSMTILNFYDDNKLGQIETFISV